MLKWRGRQSRGERRERGATLVEFALVAPLLFILLFGIVDLGRMVAAYSGVVSAAREAARYGSAAGISPNGVRHYVDCDGIREAGQTVSTLVDIPDASIVIEYDSYVPALDDFEVFGTCPVSSSAVTSEHRVRVTITADVPLITPIVGRFFDGGQVSLTVVEARSLFENENV